MLKRCWKANITPARPTGPAALPKAFRARTLNVRNGLVQGKNDSWIYGFSPWTDTFCQWKRAGNKQGKPTRNSVVGWFFHVISDWHSSVDVDVLSAFMGDWYMVKHADTDWYIDNTYYHIDTYVYMYIHIHIVIYINILIHIDIDKFIDSSPHHLGNLYPTIRSSLSFSTLHPGDLPTHWSLNWNMWCI